VNDEKTSHVPQTNSHVTVLQTKPSPELYICYVHIKTWASRMTEVGSLLC